MEKKGVDFYLIAFSFKCHRQKYITIINMQCIKLQFLFNVNKLIYSLYTTGTKLGELVEGGLQRGVRRGVKEEIKGRTFMCNGINWASANE